MKIQITLETHEPYKETPNNILLTDHPTHDDLVIITIDNKEYPINASELKKAIDKIIR